MVVLTLRALFAVLQSTGLLVLTVRALHQQRDSLDCPSNYENGFEESVVEAVCAFQDNSEYAIAFRNETRIYHNDSTKTDDDDTSALLGLFSTQISYVEFSSSCTNVDREHVTWCVRLAHTNRTIETCVSLDENLEPVYESTCDAQYLKLKEHMSLPSREVCMSSLFSNRQNGGCLGLTNIQYIFKDAYFTSIIKTDTCSEVTFKRSLNFSPSDKPPIINEITVSPHHVQPSEQIVLRAEATSVSATAFVEWQKGNITYTNHINEDPQCNPDRDFCGDVDTHPDVEQLKEQRIRSYVFTRALSRDCLNSGVFSVETYLIIDNATESEAGLYTVNVTTVDLRAFTDIEEVNVIIECDQSLFSKANCSRNTIVVDRGESTEWKCEFKAPHYYQPYISVVLNKTIALPHFDIDGKNNLEDICDVIKVPYAAYYVVADYVHTCYSQYSVHVVVCSTDDSFTGDYSVVWGHMNVTDGSTVDVKLQDPGLQESDDGDRSITPAAFVVPIVVLIISLVGVVIIMVVIIRRGKRKRAHSPSNRLQSPDSNSSAPEAVFYKWKIENGQFSPASLLSPQSIKGGAYNDSLEFPRNRLYVYTNKVLGEGSFGRVLQAKAEGIVPGMPERNLVAIKTTKENATSIEVEELLSELDLMKKMIPHENILNLLGQCTTPGGPVCLIVEFARYGNLRDFLRQCEEVVLSLNHKPHFPRNRSRTGTFSSSSLSSTQPLIIRQDSSVFTPGNGQQFIFPLPSPSMSTNTTSSSNEDSKQTASHPSTAVPLAHSVAPIGHDYINSKGLVFMEDVHNFALQIACGLQHLASMQIVHCDLAARNVLIAEGFVLKIADFGLARDISGRELYKKSPKGKIPVKWTAPEALENGIFTTKSDIWSYGVVLWELFTYGHTPYPDVHLGPSCEAIISYLKDGNRMEKPESCSDEFYELMLKCWSLIPDNRPTPVDLVANLTPLDGKVVDAVQNNNTQPMAQKNMPTQ